MYDRCEYCSVKNICHTGKCDMDIINIPEGYEIKYVRKVLRIKDISDTVLVRCCGCGERKTKKHFSPSLIVSSTASTGYCKTCHNAYKTSSYRKRATLGL